MDLQDRASRSSEPSEKAASAKMDRRAVLTSIGKTGVALAAGGLIGGIVNPQTALSSTPCGGLDCCKATTLAELRAMSTTPLADCVYYVTDPGQEGHFIYDAADTVSADNTGTIIVSSAGARLKRVVDGAVNVRWFGAKGNGTTDDAPAFQQAVDTLFALYGTGGKVEVPPGRYRIGTAIDVYTEQYFDRLGLPRSTLLSHTGAVCHILFEGHTLDNTFLVCDNDDGIFRAQSANSVDAYFSASIRDMKLISQNQRGIGFHVVNDTVRPWHFFFRNVAFFDFDYGFKFDRRSGSLPVNGYTHFTQCFFRYNTYGAFIGGDNTVFEECFIERNLGYGLIVDSGWQIQYNGGKIQYNGNTLNQSQVAIYDGTHQLSFNEVYFEPQSSAAPFTNNEGKSLISIQRDNTSGTIRNITLNNCYLNAHKLMYLMEIGANLEIQSITIEGGWFRRFKLNSAKELISLDSASTVSRFYRSSSNTLTNMMDATETEGTEWRLSSKDMDGGFGAANPVVTPEQQLNGGNFTFIAGSVQADATHKYFGRAYTVSRSGTGVYRVTLMVDNAGVFGGTSTHFPVCVTVSGQTTDVIIASVDHIDTNEFDVRLRKTDGTPIDADFSFLVTVSVKQSVQ